MSKRQRKAQTQRRRRAAVTARSVGAAGGLAIAATLLSGAVAEAETITVSSLQPSGTNTLAAAISAANTYGAAHTSATDTIVFASGLSGTIALTGELPEITEPVTITGPGANLLTIHGSGSAGIFEIGSGLSSGTVIEGLTLTGGSATDGGAVYADSSLGLFQDTIEGNTASAAGGGVAAKYGVSILGTTISGNTAGTSGGGVFAEKGLDAKYSTIANNTATDGDGGGLFLSGDTLYLDGTTVAGNHADGASGEGLGGGVYIDNTVTSAAVDDTIVYGDTASESGPDFYTSTAGGAVTPTASYSLLGSTTSSGITPDSTDKVGANPLLGALQNNGGPTPTMAPAYNSPVIDQGKTFSLSADQRGDPRPTDLPGYPNATGGDGSDIGSVELQPSEVLPAVTGLSVASGTTGTSVTISGSRLATATQVLFGTTAATFTVNASGQIVASAPAGTGTVDVRVVTPGGESVAVAADHFTYVVPTPVPTPTPTPPAPQVTSATFGNQQIIVVTPSLSACTASTGSLSATLASNAITGSHATKLKFSSAGFFLDKGVKHVKKKTEHLKNGKTKHVTVTTYTANVVVHSAPATVSLKLAGLKAGSHTLKVVISYKETVTKHGKKKTETVTKTISSKFTVC